MKLGCVKGAFRVQWTTGHSALCLPEQQTGHSVDSKVDGIEVEEQKSTNFLGIILDSN